MSLQEQNRDNAFHERISILKDEGYRGFKIHKVNKEWDGVQVIAKNQKGRTVTGSGETNEEAYIKLIEQIDQALEIH